jgi:hypothetical protein
MHAERRPWIRWTAALGVAATTAGVVLVQAQAPTPPPILADALKAQPAWRLLDPTTDLVGDYTIKQLEELDRWPPWLEQDFDKDGHDDIAAVVVRRAKSGETEYAVVVAQPGRSELVVPFSTQRIFGVSEGIADDTVMPLRCADCEANVWYRWNGRAYEPLLYAPGEPLRIGGEAGKPSPLFDDARSTASRLGELPPCARARVLEVAGEEGRRWYRVEAIVPTLKRGWVPQPFVATDADCKD